MHAPEHRQCSSCFFSTQFPGIVIEDGGRCSLCNASSAAAGKAEPQAPRVEELRRTLAKLREGKRGRYDCIVGVSGGFDSSYVLYAARRLLGLNPLAVNYDSGLGHDLARRNLRTVCDRLGVDLRVVRSSQGNDLKFVRSMVLALRDTGLYWGVCRFCQYVLSAVAYEHALAEGIPVLLTSTNVYEKRLHMAPAFKRRLLVRALLGRGGVGLPRFLYYLALAQYYLLRLKLEFYLPPISNLLSSAPKTPAIVKLSVSKYLPWDVDAMVRTLEQDAGWSAPEGSRLPMRFDCLVEDGLVNQTYKKAGGLTIHAIICNNLIHGGVRTKAELQDDVARYDARVSPSMGELMARLGLE